MKIMYFFFFIALFLSASPVFADPTPTPCVAIGPNGETLNCIMIDREKLGFNIPNLSDILTFALRGFFVIGGLAALFFLLLGAFAWITSGGDKDKVSAAQQKIQAAVIGVIMIAVVLAIVVTLEQVIFSGRVCLGLSCPITIPTLLNSSDSSSSSTNPNVPVLDNLRQDDTVVVTATPIPPPSVNVTDSVAPNRSETPVKY